MSFLVARFQADTIPEAGLLAELTVQGAVPLVKALTLLVIGLPLVYGLSRVARRLVGRHLTPQRGLVAGKVVFYPGLLLIATSIMGQLGFSLAPLLGAAGIMGIAIGFASQTSVSNIISGLFLIGEQPFVVDDVIQVGDTTGQVLSIDTLSVKLRTFDNKFVRLPNESIIKSQVTNLTRFPIRRLDVMVGVAYREDVGRVRAVLLEVADQNPLALMDPEPKVIFEGFADSSINFKFAVWAAREDFLQLKNTLQEGIKARFDEEGIEIPFPHRSLYVGSQTEPFPISIVEPSSPATQSAGHSSVSSPENSGGDDPIQPRRQK